MNSSEDTVSRPILAWKRWQILLGIVVLALVVRIWAAWQLPPDADEPVYSRAAQAYAQAIKAGNWQAVIDYADNQEHPVLVKLMDSLPYLLIRPKYGSSLEVTFNRLISAFWGTLAVGMLALINPLAGFMLAMDSMTIKYTSEVYLEAFPLFMMILAVYSLKKALVSPERSRWFWISALAFGVMISGKYIYGLVALPLGLIFIQQKKASWQNFFLYALTGLLAFWILDPYLWVDPLNRLLNSLFFHVQYTQGSNVLLANYPWYQALNWITMSVPWHPDVFFFPTLDVVTTLLAMVGLWSELKTRPWVVAWALFTLVVLLVWPTRWPQYTLVLKPALCLAAATGLMLLVAKAKDIESTWHWAESVLPSPGRLFWVALVLFCAFLVVGKVSYEISMAIARSGWLTVQTEFSPLPSNEIDDIKPLEDGRVVIGTAGGLAIWQFNSLAPWGDKPLTLTTENSGLPGNRVSAVLTDYQPDLWLGTNAGLAYTDGQKAWINHSFQEMGLATDKINALASDQAGAIWVATNNGAAALDSHKNIWKTYTKENSGLQNNIVYSLAVNPGKEVYFGTLSGLDRLDLQTQQWQSIDINNVQLSFGGVTHLYLDRKNLLWVSTPGSGISSFDGKQWKNYRTSNSDITQNNVTRIIEDSSGSYWLGLAFSSEPGGQIARLNGGQWTVFDRSNSGFDGLEPSSLTIDQAGRVWIGTLFGGLQIYQPPQNP